MKWFQLSGGNPVRVRQAFVFFQKKYRVRRAVEGQSFYVEVNADSDYEMQMFKKNFILFSLTARGLDGSLINNDPPDVPKNNPKPANISPQSGFSHTAFLLQKFSI